MKKLVFLAVVAATLCLAVGSAFAAEGKVLSVAALSETLDSSEYITGARLEYSGEVKAGDVYFNRPYQVIGYTVTGTYVNNDGIVDHAEQQGKYVFLKFAPPASPSSNAEETQHRYGNINFFWSPDVVIRQREVLTLADGSTVSPASHVTTKLINPNADSFMDLAFTDKAGTKLTYRLYAPKGYEAKNANLKNLPLVVYWSGGSSPGTSNLPQHREFMPAVFAGTDSQADFPCFVMAPQSTSRVNPGPGVWTQNNGTKEQPSFGPTPSMTASVEAITDVIGKFNIDPARVYGTGHSQGARAVWMTSIMEPNLLAAHFATSSCDIYPDSEILPLINKPAWVLVTENDRPDRPGQTGALADQVERLGGKVTRKLGKDGFNGFLRGVAAERMAAVQIADAKKANATFLYTHFIANTVVPDVHNSLVFSASNKAIRGWLFSQSK